MKTLHTKSKLGALAALLSLLAGVGNAEAAPQCAAADVNGDGTVDVADIQCFISVVMAYATRDRSGVNCLAIPWSEADLNCDGFVNISDLQLVVHAASYGTLPWIVDQDQDGVVDACD